jgi:TP53 regulating kinase and related kinases
LVCNDLFGEKLNYLIGKIFETNIGDLLIKKELGKGKSGYSYLSTLNNQKYVLKLIHNEPCPYYHFCDNKVIMELNAYRKLKSSEIFIPELLDYDPGRKYIVKDYIDGIVASQFIAENKIKDSILEQLFKMFRLAKKMNLNIDYFPTNFVWQDNQLFYIDYECNPYMPEWDLLNWGIYYWANTKGFRDFLSTGDILYINESSDSGTPIKKPLYKKVKALIQKNNLLVNQI